MTRSYCLTTHRGFPMLALFCTILLVCAMSLAGPTKKTVVLFVVDGLQTDAATVAMNNGAAMIKQLYDNGVWVEEAYCTSPSARLYLPDGSTPWGTAAPPNVAMHTGTHVFESRQMDDIFLAARRAGIKSVFSGSADNYQVFNTADYCYAKSNMDSAVIEFAIKHIHEDHARLISIHLQQTRRNWTGPTEKLNPQSPYQKYLLTVDRLLDTLVRALQSEGVWDSTYVVLFSDHGMGNTSASEHPATVLSSWKPYMNFYGPGIKKGTSLPYAETPDVAVLVDYVMGLSPLKGHTDPNVGTQLRGTTGTLLTNLFEGNPDDIRHPKFIRRYLESKDWSPPDDFADYRAGMLKLLGK